MAVCTDCHAGPLTTSSFRRLMNGEKIVHETTRDKIKIAMDGGCGLCRLLWLTCEDKPRLKDQDISFRLTVKSLRAYPYIGITPEDVQFLSIGLRKSPGLLVQQDEEDKKEEGIGARRHYIYTSTDDPSAAEVVARSPILEVASPRAYELARKALADCIASHERCPEPGPETPLPTRVIDCEDPSHPCLFVSQETLSRYVALSYVWGEAQEYCTKCINVDKYTTGIDTEYIPQTIRDAIEVTTALGLRYLWVDALCIIQDSDDDKARELVKMRQIYRDAYVTIVASSAATASAGFLQTRVLPREYIEHPQLPFYCHDGRVGSMFAFTQRPEYKPMKEPINRRAWCLQESLLSPRKLVYTAQTIQYYCQTSKGSLGNAISFPDSAKLDDIIFVPRHASGPNPDIPTRISTWTPSKWESLHLDWSRIVINYSRRLLSHQEDKLLALAGVAEEFHRVWGTRAGRYLGGLWENLLPNDLLWSRASEYEDSSSDSLLPLLPRPSRSFAPSWSWASVDGEVFPYGPSDIRWGPDDIWGDSDDEDQNDEDKEGDEEYDILLGSAKVLGCDMTLEDDELPYGHVVAASLRLRAIVVPTPWMVSPGLDPMRRLAVYMAADVIPARIKELRSHSSVVVGQRSEDVNGNKVPVHAVVLREDQLRRLGEGELVALDRGMKEDESLLTYMGEISVIFDASGRVDGSKITAVVVRRFQEEDLCPPGAEGVLVTDAGGGKFRRIAHWESLGEQRIPWLDDYNPTIQVIELV